MDKLELHLLAILLLVSATVIQQNEAYCGRKPCTSDANCTHPQLCLGQAGQTGNKVCSYCGCNKISECYMEGNKQKCNCSESAGYYGDYCDCKPKSTDCYGDEWGIYKTCTTYSDTEFVLFENVGLSEGNGFNHILNKSIHYNACMNECTTISCLYYTFGDDHCMIYGKPSTNVAGSLLLSVGYSKDTNLYIRKCVSCAN